MADSKSDRTGSALAPFKALRTLGQQPVTLPMEPRPASEVYRGFHLNNWDQCIGCGTCAEICDNRAIHMVHLPELPEDPARGIRPLRPAVDYGRCCWCALCVDMCPTGALALSREYIHVDPDPDTFFILPDADGMHGLGYPEGWAKSADSDLLDLDRHPMPERDPGERVADFEEVQLGFDDETALLEASRCIQCGMCHDACPTHMHAPEYIRAIWEGDQRGAVAEIYRTNPFGHVCGRICTHYCESACSLHHRGEPIAIRFLKRYAMDSVTAETGAATAARDQAGPSGYSVAIVGAGPAGLTAAFDLAREGHSVQVYDSYPQAGGMMRWGIPEYRLPKDRLGTDIEAIAELGVTVHSGVRVGEEVTMAELEAGHEAVILATGLHKGRSTRIPGTEHERVITALELLRWTRAGEPPEAPAAAVIIGGGNVAMDAARTAARLQGTAGRPVNVTITTLESREEMAAAEEEIAEAEREGVAVINSRGPQQCRLDATGERLLGLETAAVASLKDADGRFHPKFDTSDTRLFEADLIIEAIGQTPELGFLGEELTERLEWQRGRPVIDTDGRTSEPWLWAVGNLVEGPDVVHAIAAGHRVAASIHRQLATAEEVHS